MKKKIDNQIEDVEKQYDPDYISVGYLDFHAVFDVLLKKEELDQMKHGDVEKLKNSLSVGSIGKEINMVQKIREELKNVIVKNGIPLPDSLVIKLV